MLGWLLLAGQALAQGTDPAIQKGLGWLQGQIDGSGQLASEAASIALPMQVRSETATTLKTLTATPPAALYSAIDGITPDTTEYLARKALARQLAGSSNASLLAALVQTQNADGGFGAAAGMQSNPLDTAYALMALAPARTDTTLRTLMWLTGNQQANGAWLLPPDSDAVVTTALAMQALASYSDQADAKVALAKARTWLLAQRNASQTWDDDLRTAQALLALWPGLNSAASVQPAIDALRASQRADGSWAGDPYITALALRVLRATLQASPNQILIQGRVVDGQTGQALSGVSVALNGAQSYSRQTDADGQFTFVNPAAGSYTISVSLAGFGPVTGTIAVVAGQTLNLGTIALLPGFAGTMGGTIKGIVTGLGTGAPIVGAIVTVDALSVTTGTDGSYEIANVPLGAITVTASAPGYQTVTANGSVPAGGILLFSPQMTSSGGSAGVTSTLTGVVTDAATQQPILGATITVTGATLASTQTAANGSYQIAGIPFSTVQISVAAAGYDSVVAVVQSHGGATVMFSPALYPTGTSPPGANTSGIEGTVVDVSTNLALAGVSIAVTLPDGTTQTASTDPNGRFTIAGLTQEQAALDFTKTGYVAVQLTAWTTPLETIDIGQVRLRTTEANVLLPDLKVVSVDAKSSTTRDPRTFQLSGTVQATISNIGTAPTSGEFNVLAFYDVNNDGKFDAGTDIALGTTRITQTLEIGQSLPVAITVSGTMPFRDAPVSVAVDGSHEIIELDETNNVASSAALCSLAPQAAVFTPRLKWAWTGSTVMPQYDQVEMGPAVARTHDTNGDGKIDQDDIPSVIFTAYHVTGTARSSDSILRIVSGKDGSDVVTVTDPLYRLPYSANLAVGDINGDGYVEIVGPKLGGGLVAFAHDGTPLWSLSYAVPTNHDHGGPAIVDLNGDGHPIIIAGGRVVSASGALLWRASNGYIGGIGDASGGIAVDLDNDGHMAVLLGASAFSADGQLLWQNSTVGDGFNAIGRFNLNDPYPEIVVVGNGKVSLLDHTGKLIWGPVALPGGGNGGAPLVADLDGDGIPEIGVAGYGNYVVFNHDGSVRWTKPTQDYSSSVTSSTVFDFFNDGRKEIAYADERYLHIYDGATGAVLWETQNSSGTAVELPVLADIDASGQASLLVTSNYANSGQYAGATHGIRAFTDQNDNWPGTRQIWNQLSYHIDNVNDDGSIPLHESPSWLTHNTYRLNTKTDAFGLADLTAGRLQVIDTGAGQPLTLRARVGNAGAIASGATTVAFYDGDPSTGGTLLGTVPLASLAPATWQDVQLTGVASLTGANDIYAVVNEDYTFRECDKSNNVTSTPYAASNLLATLKVATDAPEYGMNSPVQLTGTAANKGSFAVDLSVDLRIEDADGNLVIDFGTQPVGAVIAGATAHSTQAWNTATTLAGPYVLHGLLYRSDDGSLLDEARTTFNIVPDTASASATSTLATDRYTYSPSDRVTISSAVLSQSSNLILSNLTLTVQVVDAGGAVQFTHDYTIAQLLPGARLDFSVQQTLLNAPAGTYTVKQDLLDEQQNVIHHVETTYQVGSTRGTGFGLTGIIAATPKAVHSGEIINLAAAATNRGNADLDNLPLTLYLIDPNLGSVVAHFHQTSTVATGASVPFDATWTTQGQAGTTYWAVLAAQIDSSTEIPLAQDSFQLLAGPVAAAPVPVPLDPRWLLLCALCVLLLGYRALAARRPATIAANIQPSQTTGEH